MPPAELPGKQSVWTCRSSHATASNRARRFFLLYQVVFSIGAGYVYCIIYFLVGGRLLPTVLLHSLNNVAASFYYTARNPEDGINGNPSCAFSSTDCDGHGSGRVACALDPELWRRTTSAVRRGAGTNEALAAPFKVHVAVLATALAYGMAGRACSNYVRGLNGVTMGNTTGITMGCPDSRPDT